MRRSYFLLPSMFYIVVAAFLTSCEVHKIDPEQDAKEREETLTWSKEMGEIVNGFTGEYNKFYASALTLVGKVKLLTNHPGWPDMATIISSDLSIRYIEGEERASQKKAFALSMWNKKYDLDGQNFLSKYYEFMGESLSLEFEKTKLIELCDKMPSIIFTRVVKLALLTKNYSIPTSDIRKIEEERYSKIKYSLNAFRVGTFGLYEMNAR